MPAEPLEPTLTGIGLTLGAPDIASLPSAGSATRIDVPFKIKDRKALPKGLQASVRWDPIDVPIVAPDPATEVGGAAPAASAAPSAAAAPAARPAPVASPAASPVASPAPAVAAADPSAAASAAPTTAATDAPKAATTTTKPVKGAAAPAAAGQPSASPSAAPSVAPAVGSGADTPKGRRVAPPPARIEPRLAPPAEQLDLVVPEQTGDVVSPAAVKVGKKTIPGPGHPAVGTRPVPPDDHRPRRRRRGLRRGHPGSPAVADRPGHRRLRRRDPGDPHRPARGRHGLQARRPGRQPGDRSVGPQGHPADVEPVGLRQGGSGQRRRDLDPAVGRGVGPRSIPRRRRSARTCRSPSHRARPPMPPSTSRHPPPPATTC